MSEIWIDINKYKGIYKISNLGNVKNSRGKILKTRVGTSGYEQIGLHKDNKVKYFLIHRLVATHFIINNDDNKSQVNHKDGNKLNNCVDNLEWSTPLNNTQHAISMGLVKCKKPILQLDIKTNNVIRSFSSIKEAAIYTGSEKHDAHIVECCKGRRNKAYGYNWKYIK